MEFNIKSGSPEKQRVACVIVGVYEARKLSFAADLLDPRISMASSATCCVAAIWKASWAVRWCCIRCHTLCDQVMLVGLGKERDFREKEYRDAVAPRWRRWRNRRCRGGELPHRTHLKNAMSNG